MCTSIFHIWKHSTIHQSIPYILHYFFPFLGHFEWEGSYGLSRTAVWGRPWLQGSYHHSEWFVFILTKEKCGASWRILESSNEVGTLKWDASFLMGSNLFPPFGGRDKCLSRKKKWEMHLDKPYHLLDWYTIGINRISMSGVRKAGPPRLAKNFHNSTKWSSMHEI